MANDAGILSYGAYLPRRRLQRSSILAANSWFAPGLRGLAKGERTMANWDEDSVTMAVEAARDCLGGLAPADLGQLMFASTTHPYDDRQNAAIVANALHLGSSLRVLDVTGSQRAGTSALISALNSGGNALVAAAEHRLAQAASPQEMHYGDGGAALLLGRGATVARFIGSHSETVDFVHQFRASERAHDYAWEERWIRDEGYMKIVPAALAALFKGSDTAASSVTHFCMPCTLPRVAAGLAKRVGLPETALRDNLAAVCGDTGVAHPLHERPQPVEARLWRQAFGGRRVVAAGLAGEGDAAAGCGRRLGRGRRARSSSQAAFTARRSFSSVPGLALR